MTVKTYYNLKNENIKNEFFSFLRVEERDEKTIDSYSLSIHEYEVFDNFADFKTFNSQKATSFIDYLTNKVNKSGKGISKSYLTNTIYNVKRFFDWLNRQPSYQKHINYNDIAYLRT
jgi:site-specific recombinase XerD